MFLQNTFKKCRSSRSQMLFRIGVKKETPTQVYSTEYRKVFKNSFFYGTPLVAVSENDGRISKNF